MISDTEMGAGKRNLDLSDQEGVFEFDDLKKKPILIKGKMKSNIKSKSRFSNKH